MDDRQRELQRERSRRYRERHPERVREAKKKWSDANPGYAAEHYQDNRDVYLERTAKRRQEKGRHPDWGSRLRREYGIDLESYAHMLIDQGYACASCRDYLNLGDFRYIHLDHCHDSREVRGILCRHCNTALGLLRDDVGRIAALATYLLRAGGGSS